MAEKAKFCPSSTPWHGSSSPKMTQQLRDLQLAHARKQAGPSSPNAAKRLYRNLSGKFRVNYMSFDEGNLAGKAEKEKQRKSYLFQGNAALFEAVELQDLDKVQELLKQYSLEELDLNTPNSEGLLPLDIAIMTNNSPIAKTLLLAGAKESPHFVSLESRSLHLATLVREAEQRVNDLTAQVVNEVPNAESSEKEKQLKAWEWRYRLYKRMNAGFEHARVPDPPTNVHLSVASSTSVEVSFQEPLSVNSAIVTKYKERTGRSSGPPPQPGEDGAPTLCVSRIFFAEKMGDKMSERGLLGIQDLGQVFFEPIKDKQGNILVVTLKEVKSNQTFESVRWVPVSKLQTSRKSISSPEEPTALDVLLMTMQEKLAYHQNSSQALPPGLYLGYLKLCSAVDQIRVLVPEQLPNILCHVKIRSNSNVSREEWEWLQNLASMEEPISSEQELETSQQLFLQELQGAIRELMQLVNIPLHEAKDFRLYSQEVLDFGRQVSFLLLLPPSDDVCTAPGQNNPYTPRSGFLTLPLQIFELVHFFIYDHEFISQYCQQMEEIWREMRWMMDALQHARYKQPSCGLPLVWFVKESSTVQNEKTQSTSSHLDFLPSPTPSPEMSRKLNSDEEGSSEVFLATDSDYDSSSAQSPRELDLVYSSSSGLECCRRRAVRPLRDSAPDVLQSHELKMPPMPPPKEPQPLSEQYDSDFVLPSRQIELLRITEKRQAYCVRTSSLDFPKPFCHGARKSCPGSVDSSPTESRTAGHCGSMPSGTRPAFGSGHDWHMESSGAVFRTRSVEWTQTFQETPEPGRVVNWGRLPGSFIVRVCAQYETGLSKETSVKVPLRSWFRLTSIMLPLTNKMSAEDMVKLVVQETNEASRKVLGNANALCYSEEQLSHFALVFVSEDVEQWLPNNFLPLSLQKTWPNGRFCVRIKDTSPLLFRYGPATTNSVEEREKEGCVLEKKRWEYTRRFSTRGKGPWQSHKLTSCYLFLFCWKGTNRFKFLLFFLNSILAIL
ncbi:Ankyrin repeat and fibronectin type-III domain-containing protein 1, partial [Ophiophagus hannah]